MKLRSLWALQAVMETGSVTEAAIRIHRTQPQVSRLIAALADDLGFKLFHRQGRGLIPTQECLRFYESTRHILTGFDEVSRIAESIRNHKNAILRIVTQPYFAYSIMPRAIAEFAAKYPGVDISVEVRSRVDVGSWVSGQAFDLGLAALPVEFSGVDAHEFADAELVAVVPQGHALACKDTVTCQDLVGEPFINLRRLTLIRKYVDALCAEHKLRLTISAETSSGLSACQMVAAGVGITLADPVLSASIAGVVRRPFKPTLTMPYGLLLPTAFAPSETTRAFSRIVLHTIKSASPEYVALLPAPSITAQPICQTVPKELECPLPVGSIGPARC